LPGKKLFFYFKHNFTTRAEPPPATSLNPPDQTLKNAPRPQEISHASYYEHAAPVQ